MIPADVFSGLLESLYAATLDEAQWQIFLQRLCTLTGSVVALVVDNNSTRGIQVLAANAKVPEDIDAGYQASYRYTDPIRQAYLRKPRLGVIEGEELIAHEELVETEVFKTLAAPRGLIHVTLLAISLSTRSQELISLWRGPGSRWLTPEHKELLEMLIPHLQTVFRIRRTLGMAEERADNAEAMLDASPAASILLDGAGRLVYMNQAAERLAMASDGFTIVHHRVTPSDPSQRSRFAALVAACNADANAAGGALALSRGPHRRPLQVFVAPLRVAGSEQTAVRALMLATDPDQGAVFPDSVLRQLYGLTPAETEVVNGILTGFSLEEIAQIRRVSIATVRTQMRNILAKTNTHRQSELVRLIASLPLLQIKESPAAHSCDES
jgi:DNA-binding CsgD family transcriptional regulator/PAS domain-containing protein